MKNPLRLPSLFLAATGLAVGVAVPASPVAAQYPEPSLAPVGWEFDFSWRDPRRIEVPMPDGETKAYWVLPYTVTNNSDLERPFFPDATMLTRDGRTITANRGVPKQVYDAVIDRYRSMPLLIPSRASGRLLLGEDRARSSMFIWEEPMAEMGRFRLFVAGLSGQIEPVVGRDGETLTDADGLPVLVRKTKELTFRVRGDAMNTGRDPVVFERERWVMR
jgi:hypothetical protein